jgi:hypothetical protein
MVTATARTPYRVQASYLEACSCNHGCNCQFAGYPNEALCEFVMAFEIDNGKFGSVDLRGVRVVIVLKYPNAIHEGNGRAVCFVSDSATDAQLDAVRQILSGKHGGMPWEALASTLTQFDGPTRAPIEIDTTPYRARLLVPHAVDVQLTPLTNPVTGVEKDVHIVYPKGGFFWNDGSIATTDRMNSTCDGVSFAHPGKYAATANIDWKNA